MGAHATMYIRVLGADGRWRFVVSPKAHWPSFPYCWELRQNYAMFAAMAGLRDRAPEGLTESYLHNQGLPEDVEVNDVGVIVEDGAEIGSLYPSCRTSFTLKDLLCDPIWDQVVTDSWGERTTRRMATEPDRSKLLQALLKAGPPANVQVILGFDL